jgi:hypothetical protein
MISSVVYFRRFYNSKFDIQCSMFDVHKLSRQRLLRRSSSQISDAGDFDDKPTVTARKPQATAAVSVFRNQGTDSRCEVHCSLFTVTFVTLLFRSSLFRLILCSAAAG